MRIGERNYRQEKKNYLSMLSTDQTRPMGLSDQWVCSFLVLRVEGNMPALFWIKHNLIIIRII